MPSQLGAALHHPLLLQYLQLRPSGEADLRLDLWLAQCLDELLALQGTEQSAAFITELLSLVLAYVRGIKVSVNPEALM